MYFQCKTNEFTCNDGSCIDLEYRCDDNYDCSDRSDEKNCRQITIDNDYRNIIAPTTDIKLRLKVREITNINELGKTFDADLKFFLQWRDLRLKFNDLKENRNVLNALSLKEQIWLPPLYFSNTKGKVPISTGYSFDLQIIRQGTAVKNGISQWNEGNVYSGSENDLYLAVKIQSTFQCFEEFEFSKFPFDIQHCKIIVKIPKDLVNRTTMTPQSIVYTGMVSPIFLI